MSLDKTQLKTTLESILNGVSPEAIGIKDPAELRKKVASELADAFDAFVKSGKVTVDSGITLSTTGTATAQTGKTTGQGTGTIS